MSPGPQLDVVQVASPIASWCVLGGYFWYLVNGVSLCVLLVLRNHCVLQCHGASLENGAALRWDSNSPVHAAALFLMGCHPKELFPATMPPNPALKSIMLYTSASICQWKSEGRDFISWGSLVLSNCSFWNAQHWGCLFWFPPRHPGFKVSLQL